MRRQAELHFIARQFHHPSGANRTEKPLLEDAWSMDGGVDGSQCLRVKGRRDSVWVYYTVYYRVPATPGSRRNVAVHRLGTCPPFAGEFIVMRRSESNGFVDMRPHDCKNAVHVVTACVLP